MRQEICGEVRELIPDFVRNALAPDESAVVEAHVSGCGECKAEFELVHVLFAGRAIAPASLAQRVMTSVGRDRRPVNRPWWGISAAAVAALALGIGIASDSSGSRELEIPGFAYEVEADAQWLSGDGLLAGAPALDQLSDEALSELLEQLATGALEGGSA